MRYGKFRKRKVGVRDVENIARHIVSGGWEGGEGGRGRKEAGVRGREEVGEREGEGGELFKGNICLSQIMYCLNHYSGDEKVPPYVLNLMNPSIVTENPVPGDSEDFYYDFTVEDFQILREKDPEALFHDLSYRKHLRRHSNK